LARRDPSPPWQLPFVLAFTGVRGVVSLAAALAIPLVLANGQPFPYRDLILFVTFGVIILTLVGQGLMLPTVIRWVGLGDRGEEHRRETEAEHAARRQATELSGRRLQEIAARGDLPAHVLDLLMARQQIRTRQSPKGSEHDAEIGALAARLRLELIDAERRFLYEQLRAGKITDESRRRLERELDLEEAGIACKREGGGEVPL
jgi:CPA1 family monovalent cation:H+ antiporter